MKHHIIVKFKNDVGDKAALIREAAKLFSGCDSISGVHGCRLFQNCVDRENRYDLMIVLDMELAALPAWDSSDIHRIWKESFGKYIAAKAIFDCEDE